MNTYNMLIDIEQRCKDYSLQLPQDTTQHQKPWIGIVFLLNNQFLVLELKSILEVMQSVSISEVPCTVDWIIGITNFRGNLIPIIDVNKSINGNFTKSDKKLNILILKHDEKLLAICTSKVIGLKKFDLNSTLSPEPNLESNHEQFIKQYFYDGNMKIKEINVELILENFENNFLFQET